MYGRNLTAFIPVVVKPIYPCFQLLIRVDVEHGLGDAPRAFAALGRKMALPETAALALRAPLPLPAGLDGTAWHESFDADDAGSFTRPWFAWANSLFGQLISKLSRERPHLIGIPTGLGSPTGR